MTDFKIKLANKVIKVSAICPSTKDFCKDYFAKDAENVDFEVVMTEKIICDERAIHVAENGESAIPYLTDEYVEQLALYRAIVEELVEYGIVMFHGSAIAVDGVAYIFTALSGTGKSTHTRLWRSLFGDRAVMVNDDKPLLTVGQSGVTVHGSPWNGNNALYAATAGLSAVNSIRETFQEKDIIRVHPIITKGGSMVNAIPGEVTLESYVRGSSFEGIVRENKKVNRAFIGGALSLETNIDITDFPGYAPLKNDKNMMLVAKEACQEMLPDYPFNYNESIGSGSTDMGDLSCVMPVVHPYAAGSIGTSHGADYYVADPVKACVDCAKWQLAMLYTLLKDDAKRAYKIVEEYEAPFTIKEYVDYMDSLYQTGERITYSENEVKINL